MKAREDRARAAAAALAAFRLWRLETQPCKDPAGVCAG